MWRQISPPRNWPSLSERQNVPDFETNRVKNCQSRGEKRRSRTLVLTAGPGGLLLICRDSARRQARPFDPAVRAVGDRRGINAPHSVCGQSVRRILAGREEQEETLALRQ